MVVSALMKIAVFSANYRPPGQLDSYRRGLLTYLSSAEIETLLAPAWVSRVLRPSTSGIPSP
jgi:hypothetical protein